MDTSEDRARAIASMTAQDLQAELEQRRKSFSPSEPPPIIAGEARHCAMQNAELLPSPDEVNRAFNCGIAEGRKWQNTMVARLESDVRGLTEQVRLLTEDAHDAQPCAGFHIVCLKCGGTNIHSWHEDLGASDCTDFGSESGLRCRKCGHTYTAS